MKLLRKIAAGALLGIGVSLSVFLLAQLVNPKAVAKDREDATIGLLLLGLPPTVLGGWLTQQVMAQGQQEESDRLRSTFFRLLKAGNGSLTLLQFAMETELDGDTARSYLDERAKEFNATFNVTEEGKLSYYFDLGSSAPSVLSAASSHETYDVILESVSSGKRNAVVREVRELLGSDWGKAKRLVKQLPRPVVVCQAVDRPTAEQYRDRLEAAGASVIVVLK